MFAFLNHITRRRTLANHICMLLMDPYNHPYNLWIVRFLTDRFLIHLTGRLPISKLCFLDLLRSDTRTYTWLEMHSDIGASGPLPRTLTRNSERWECVSLCSIPCEYSPECYVKIPQHRSVCFGILHGTKIIIGSKSKNRSLLSSSHSSCLPLVAFFLVVPAALSTNTILELLVVGLAMKIWKATQ